MLCFISYQKSSLLFDTIYRQCLLQGRPMLVGAAVSQGRLVHSSRKVDQTVHFSPFVSLSLSPLSHKVDNAAFI